MIATGLLSAALAALVAQTAPPMATQTATQIAPPQSIQMAPAPPPLGESGLFEHGINLDLLEVGALQAFGPGGTAGGIVLALGPELDLGPHVALRVPLRLGVAGSSAGSSTSTSFAELVIAPGIVYRFRNDRDQRWVPFAGGALDLGAFEFGRQLLGLAPSPSGVSQSFVKIGIAPEALGGVLYCPAHFFAVRFAASYTYMLVAHTSAHALSETVDVRVMF